MSGVRMGRVLGAVGATTLLVVGATACGDDAGDEEATSSDESSEPSAPAASGPAIDCEAIDQAAVEQIAEAAVVEVEQKGTTDNFSSTVADREFEGSSTGCDIDLDIGDFGPPELTVGVYVMEDGYYDFFKESAGPKDGFTELADVGDDAFTYTAPALRTDMVADLGGQVLQISFGRGLDGSPPESADLVAIAELVTPAIG